MNPCKPAPIGPRLGGERFEAFALIVVVALAVACALLCFATVPGCAETPSPLKGEGWGEGASAGALNIPRDVYLQTPSPLQGECDQGGSMNGRGEGEGEGEGATGGSPASADPGEYFYIPFWSPRPYILRLELPVPRSAPEDPAASRWAVWLDCGDVLAVCPGGPVFANAWGDNESFPGRAAYCVSASAANARLLAIDVTGYVPAVRPATRLLGLYLVCPAWVAPQLRAARLYRLSVEAPSIDRQNLIDLLLCRRVAWAVSPSDLFACDLNADGLIDGDDSRLAVPPTPDTIQGSNR